MIFNTSCVYQKKSPLLLFYSFDFRIILEICHIDKMRYLKISKLPSKSKISYEEMEKNLYHEFKKFGKLYSLKVKEDTEFSTCAILCYASQHDAMNACETFRGRKFMGLNVRCEQINSSKIDLETYQYLTKHSGNEGIENSPVKTSRTLFVGNLPTHMKDKKMADLFKKFGHIIDIDIKTPSSSGPAYAFVQFAKIKAVTDAIERMDGHIVGDQRIKCWYGKTQPYRCLIIDTVPHGLNSRSLLKQTIGQWDSSRYKITDILVDKKHKQALIFCENEHACKELNIDFRFRIQYQSDRIKVDYASESLVMYFKDRLEAEKELREQREKEKAKIKRERRSKSREKDNDIENNARSSSEKRGDKRSSKDRTRESSSHKSRSSREETSNKPISSSSSSRNKERSNSRERESSKNSSKIKRERSRSPQKRRNSDKDRYNSSRNDDRSRNRRDSSRDRSSERSEEDNRYNTSGTYDDSFRSESNRSYTNDRSKDHQNRKTSYHRENDHGSNLKMESSSSSNSRRGTDSSKGSHRNYDNNGDPKRESSRDYRERENSGRDSRNESYALGSSSRRDRHSSQDRDRVKKESNSDFYDNNNPRNDSRNSDRDSNYYRKNSSGNNNNENFSNEREHRRDYREDSRNRDSSRSRSNRGSRGDDNESDLDEKDLENEKRKLEEKLRRIREKKSLKNKSNSRERTDATGDVREIKTASKNDKNEEGIQSSPLIKNLPDSMTPEQASINSQNNDTTQNTMNNINDNNKISNQTTCKISPVSQTASNLALPQTPGSMQNTPMSETSKTPRTPNLVLSPKEQEYVNSLPPKQRAKYLEKLRESKNEPEVEHNNLSKPTIPKATPEQITQAVFKMLESKEKWTLKDYNIFSEDLSNIKKELAENRKKFREQKIQRDKEKEEKMKKEEAKSDNKFEEKPSTDSTDSRLKNLKIKDGKLSEEELKELDPNYIPIRSILKPTNSYTDMFGEPGQLFKSFGVDKSLNEVLKKRQEDRAKVKKTNNSFVNSSIKTKTDIKSILMNDENYVKTLKEMQNTIAWFEHGQYNVEKSAMPELKKLPAALADLEEDHSIIEKDLNRLKNDGIDINNNFYLDNKIRAFCGREEVVKELNRIRSSIGCGGFIISLFLVFIYQLKLQLHVLEPSPNISSPQKTRHQLIVFTYHRRIMPEAILDTPLLIQVAFYSTG